MALFSAVLMADWWENTWVDEKADLLGLEKVVGKVVKSETSMAEDI